jgi:hypothetical protein
MPEGISKYAQRYAKRRSLCNGAEHPLPMPLLNPASSNVGNRHWSWHDFVPLIRRRFVNVKA